MNSKFNWLLFFLLLISFIGCERDNINTPLIDDGLPPNPPVGLNIWRESDGQIGIEWFRNTESGTKGYNIYRSINDTLNFEFRQFTTDDYYLDIKLNYDSTYYYRITAIDVFNNESLFSSILSATPKNKFYPLTPFDLRINARNWNDSIYIYLNWFPSGETDIDFYEIYRDTNPEFEIDTQYFHGTTGNLNFGDAGNVKILTQYYYRIVAVDQGGLKSDPTNVVTDIIFNKPGIIYPINNSELTSLSEFEIALISHPAEYKIIIQRNEYFDIIKEINFTSEEIDTKIVIPLNNITLEPYRKYFWRIITYSEFSSEANSFTDLNTFTIVP
jgi:hypothetical protein